MKIGKQNFHFGSNRPLFAFNSGDVGGVFTLVNNPDGKCLSTSVNDLGCGCWLDSLNDPDCDCVLASGKPLACARWLTSFKNISFA
jgi:hypothetical protein